MIRKILITVLTGGATYFLTDLANQPKIWALSVAIFIGGIALVAQFLDDFESRLAKTEEKQERNLTEIRSLIERGFARSDVTMELLQAVEASELQTDTIIKLVRNSTQIRSDLLPLLLCRYVQSQINHMSQFLRDLSEGGEISYEGEDRDWILGLTTQCQHTIDAISLNEVDAYGGIFDGGLWTCDLGRRYLALQRDATHRGVTIRRLFVIDKREQISWDNLLFLCRQHKDLGFQVKVLDQSTMPDVIKSMISDFVVFDSVVSYEVTSGSLGTRSAIFRTRLVLQPERVKEQMQRFEDFWSLAEEVDYSRPAA